MYSQATEENKNAKQQILKVAKKAQEKQNALFASMKEDSLAFVKSKITCKKQLTQREDAVLEHFAKNRGKIVFAKDLAAILNLPTDYVYKYIKNLRTKINENVLENATKGGYIFDFPTK